ncbi:MAG TPA: DUF3891 family protein [Candidatus Limnocylindrales bacterium]|nr:DUF3891 family protein [Candidatus Limnocylindrales bacterium]
MMLSPQADGRLLIILQIDHSRVAGAMVAHWGNKDFAEPSPYESVTVATGGHDSAWWDWEIKPTLDRDGKVVDYSVTWDWESTDYYRSPDELGRTWVDFTNRWIERLASRDPYAGFLVSMHHEGMVNGGFGYLPHMPDRTVDQPPAAAFAKRQQAFRAQLREQARNGGALPPYFEDDAVLRNWKYVQMGDQFAQILCNRHPFNSAAREKGAPAPSSGGAQGTPARTLKNAPTRPGQPDTTLSINVVDEVTGTVSPWPFDTDRLEFHIPARVLPRQRYERHDAFLRDYLKADQITVTRVLRPA